MIDEKKIQYEILNKDRTWTMKFICIACEQEVKGNYQEHEKECHKPVDLI